MPSSIPQLLTIASLLFLLAGCTHTESEAELKSKQLQRKKAVLASLSRVSALPQHISDPGDNPSTSEKISLGKLLFFDPILSGKKDVACATCHHPEFGYAEFLDVSIGVNGEGFGSKRAFKTPNDIPFNRRNAHTILNTAFNGIKFNYRYDPAAAPMFWDNRVNSLEKQALEPIKNFDEMRGHSYEEDEALAVVIKRLHNIPAYRDLFKIAFSENGEINEVNLGKAIAAFERSLVTNNSRFDQYMRGDSNAISLSEKEGFTLFKKVGCANCHNGPMFSDFKTHVLSVPDNERLPQPDSGLNNTFAFRTASLRNLRFTPPYMHNGKFKTLQQVLEFYEDISFGKSRNPLVTKDQFDPLVNELNLTVKEMAPIISFLNSLNDNNFDKSVPKAVPSGLPVGGNIH